MCQRTSCEFSLKIPHSTGNLHFRKQYERPFAPSSKFFVIYISFLDIWCNWKDPTLSKPRYYDIYRDNLILTRNLHLSKCLDKLHGPVWSPSDAPACQDFVYYVFFVRPHPWHRPQRPAEGPFLPPCGIFKPLSGIFTYLLQTWTISEPSTSRRTFAPDLDTSGLPLLWTDFFWHSIAAVRLLAPFGVFAYCLEQVVKFSNAC